MIFMTRLASKIYPYRWHTAITGIFIMILCQWGVRGNQPQQGTLAETIFITVYLSAGLLVGFSAIAFVLDPNKSDIRHRLDNPRWINIFNGIVRFISSVSLLVGMLYLVWLVAESWLALK